MARVSQSGSRLPAAALKALEAAKILGVRAGARSQHRFVAVWVVVVDGRAFARSWTLSPDGWYAALRRERHGTIQVGDRRFSIAAKPVRSERLLDAIEAAYAEKYSTPASRKWVRGFRTARRRGATVEFVPRMSAR